MDVTLQGLIVILGPIVLIAAIAWAMYNNKRSRRQVAQTEEATARLYDEQGAADKARDETA